MGARFARNKFIMHAVKTLCSSFFQVIRDFMLCDDLKRDGKIIAELIVYGLYPAQLPFFLLYIL